MVLRRLAGQEDWLTVLKECPVSMDDVPPRRRETPTRLLGCVEPAKRALRINPMEALKDA
jgi:hypothetical protein